MIIHKIDTIGRLETLKNEWDNLVEMMNLPRINSYFIWNYLILKKLNSKTSI